MFYASFLLFHFQIQWHFLLHILLPAPYLQAPMFCSVKSWSMMVMGKFHFFSLDQNLGLCSVLTHFTVTSTLTAYWTPNTGPSTPRLRYCIPKINNVSAEQLHRAMLPLLLPYKRPCCCWPPRICCHILTIDWLPAPLQLDHRLAFKVKKGTAWQKVIDRGVVCANRTFWCVATKQLPMC